MSREQALAQVAAYLAAIDGKNIPPVTVEASVSAVLALAR